jgi:hypothetical protein
MARPVSPNPDLVARVRGLVERTSIAEAARRLKLADATVARLAGGLPVAEGTELVAARRLPEAEAA